MIGLDDPDDRAYGSGVGAGRTVRADLLLRPAFRSGRRVAPPVEPRAARDLAEESLASIPRSIAGSTGPCPTRCRPRPGCRSSAGTGEPG